jgi:hypothetical protein
VRAAEVAALRRPTVAAWALNQVGRHAGEKISAALDAAEALRAAIEAAVGGDRSQVRDAERAERAAIRDAADAAAELLSADGRPPTESVRQKIIDTLKAAAQDSSVADELRSGRLTTDHSASGFGFDVGAFEELPARTEAGDDDDRARREAAERREREELIRAARARADELDAAATELERKAADATRDAARARRLATEAKAELDAL